MHIQRLLTVASCLTVALALPQRIGQDNQRRQNTQPSQTPAKDNGVATWIKVLAGGVPLSLLSLWLVTRRPPGGGPGEGVKVPAIPETGEIVKEPPVLQPKPIRQGTVQKIFDYLSDPKNAEKQRGFLKCVGANEAGEMEIDTKTMNRCLQEIGAPQELLLPEPEESASAEETDRSSSTVLSPQLQSANDHQNVQQLNGPPQPTKKQYPSREEMIRDIVNAAGYAGSKLQEALLYLGALGWVALVTIWEGITKFA